MNAWLAANASPALKRAIVGMDLEVIEAKRKPKQDKAMAIIVSDNGGGGNFEPHPEGSFNAVCVDVYDAGVVQTQYGPKHKIRIYFFCGEWTKPNDKGERFPMLVSEQFTATLSEKGNLRPFLERWRGQKFTAQELKAFDVEKLIGAPAFVQVTHNPDGDKTWANIDAALKLPKGSEAPAIPADFERRHEREARKLAENGGDPESVHRVGRPPQDTDSAGEPVPSGVWQDEPDLPF